jgi:hypothetical protein
MKKLILILLFLSLSANVFADEPAPARPRETLKEKLIGGFVKTFAKTYVATHNLERFKEKNIKKVLKMDEAKFQRVYGKIYKEMIVDAPQHLKDLWGIEEHMTREKVITRLNSFTNKKQIYAVINSVPNKMIAQHFKKYKKDFNKTMKKNGSGVDGMVDEILTDPGVAS